MLTKIDIMHAVYDKIKSIYPDYEVYLDDTKRNFETPCFFLKLITIRTQEKERICYNDCTQYISYIPQEDDPAVSVIEVRDKIDNAFWRGFQVKDRFIHMTSISHQTVGEDSDIVEMSLSFAYYDADAEDDEDVVMMEHVYDDISIEKG